MADIIQAVKRQSLTEVRQWDVDFTNDLETGVTVLSAVATHTPPSGSASTPIIGAISNNIVPIQIGPLTVTGTHTLNITATLSDGEISTVHLKFLVIY